MPVLLDDVACTGSESTLTECAASPLGAHNCDFREAAGVYCPGQQPLGNDIRAAGSALCELSYVMDTLLSNTIEYRASALGA